MSQLGRQKKSTRRTSMPPSKRPPFTRRVRPQSQKAKPQTRADSEQVQSGLRKKLNRKVRPPPTTQCCSPGCSRSENCRTAKTEIPSSSWVRGRSGPPDEINRRINRSLPVFHHRGRELSHRRGELDENSRSTVYKTSCRGRRKSQRLAGGRFQNGCRAS